MGSWSAGWVLGLVGVLLVVWRSADWLWWRPRRLERALRAQGLRGNPYRFFHGDLKETARLSKEARSEPINPPSHRVIPRLLPHLHRSINHHGMEPTKMKRNLLKWTDSMENDMIVLMAEEATKGLKIDKGFKEKAYNTVARVLSKKYNIDVKMVNIQNHLRHVRKTYTAIKGLLSVSGFGWDSEAKCVTADPEVWDKYCQAFPNARGFQGKSIELFKEMGIVVGNDQPRGNYARAGSEILPDDTPLEHGTSQQGIEEGTSYHVPRGQSSDVPSYSSTQSGTLPQEGNDTQSSIPPPRSHVRESSTSKKQRTNNNDEVISILHELVHVLRPVDPKVEMYKEIKKLPNLTRAEREVLYNMMKTDDDIRVKFIGEDEAGREEYARFLLG